jgi:hypothetical protein
MFPFQFEEVSVPAQWIRPTGSLRIGPYCVHTPGGRCKGRRQGEDYPLGPDGDSVRLHEDEPVALNHSLHGGLEIDGITEPLGQSRPSQ